MEEGGWRGSPGCLLCRWSLKRAVLEVGLAVAAALSHLSMEEADGTVAYPGADVGASVALRNI